MKFLCIGILLLLASSTIFSAEALQTVVVKFREGSEAAQRWKNSGRTGTVQELVPLLGVHSSSGFLKNSTMQAARKAFETKYQKLSLLHSTEFSDVEALSNIAVIRYSKPILPTTAASKLRSFVFVEYAEPKNIYELFVDPNDPRYEEQYALNNIQALPAWDLLNNAGISDTVVIAITDTGVDYLHEDLENSIWTNPGESGLDSEGFDKRMNGKDDDGNGFIDDWRGWDFFSSQFLEGDNDPYPGNNHGTHVAGIVGAKMNNAVGIAGANPFAKLLPVKISPDEPSNDIDFGYDAIVYAASVGAHIVNCSWGSNTYAQAEQDAVNIAHALGAIIVGAAGNDAANTFFFPASYTNATSVASLTIVDSKSAFSNFSKRVDVSAPGSNILSTLPNGQYGYDSGTSMAAPYVAAAMGMIRLAFPHYTPLQIVEQCKATTDNIDSMTPGYQGLLGSGRINLFNAVAKKDNYAAKILRFAATDESNDGVFEPNERIELQFAVQNILSPSLDVSLKIGQPEGSVFSYSHDSLSLGAMATLEEKNIPQIIAFTVPENIPSDYTAEIPVSIYSAEGMHRVEYLRLMLNPTYRTINANAIATTLNSKGNVGYNDYPYNTQGIGMKWNNSPSFLFESGLMAANGRNNISNVVRNAYNSQRDNFFFPEIVLNIKHPGETAHLEALAQYSDNNEANSAGVRILQKSYQFMGEPETNMLFLRYEVENISEKSSDSIYVGLFFDWDIGPGGSEDFIKFDNVEGFGLQYNVNQKNNIALGVGLVTAQEPLFYAIDNIAMIYDGFSFTEKWTTLSNGIGKRSSQIGDVSMVVGAGPISLGSGEKENIAFCIVVDSVIQNVAPLMKTAREFAKKNNVGDGFVFNPLPNTSVLENVYPNPSDGDEIVVVVRLRDRMNFSLNISNILGEIVLDKEIFNGMREPGLYRFPVSLKGLASGQYFVQFDGVGLSVRRQSFPFIVIR